MTVQWFGKINLASVMAIAKKTEKETAERIAADAERTTDVNLALQRLVQAQLVTSNKIDTVGKSADQIAEALVEELIA